MGRTEKAIIRQCGEQRIALPPKIAGAPQLELGLNFVYNAFQKLSTCRFPAMGGETPIPWLAMSQFCKDYGISGDEQEEFEDLIAAMDDVYLEIARTKSDAAREQKRISNGKP